MATLPRDESEQRPGDTCTELELRLTEVLTNDYGMLRRYLGDLRFEAMARSMIATHPSKQANARWYSRQLPAYLKTTPPFSDQPEIAEISLLENALNEAFDGPEVPIVTMADVAAIDPADLDNAILVMAPTLRRFSVSTNVSSLWASLKCGEQPPAPQSLPVHAEMMVWRQGAGARFRILGNEEAVAVDFACRSLPVRVLRDIVAAFDDGKDAALRMAGYLRGWLEAEIISAIRCYGETAK